MYPMAAALISSWSACGLDSSRMTLGAGSRSCRPPMLSKAAFTPPNWAEHLAPVPSHFFNLAQLPSPIHRWELPGLSDVDIWIKRDDLTGMQLSGNKVRKLEFILADAKSKGADCVITVGGIQSNHCRATAVAARYLNLDCYLILRTSKALKEQDPGLAGNLLVERLVGAHVELVSKEDYVKHGSEVLGDILSRRLTAEGRKPYFIPVGGSNSLGVWGYLQAVGEIEQQIEDQGIPEFDELVMACGSGGTTAGLALGAHLSSLKAKVHAYGVCDSPDYFYEYMQGLIDALNANVKCEDIVRVIDAKGLGYAISSSKELELVKQISETTGVILDPVYSGKAVIGMMNDIAERPDYWRGKKVLFVHTGGLLGMFDKLQQLQPLIGKWNTLKLPNDV